MKLQTEKSNIGSMITETMIFGSQKKVAQYIDDHDIKRTDYLYL